jgi:hypothetical protein
VEEAKDIPVEAVGQPDRDRRKAMQLFESDAFSVPVREGCPAALGTEVDGEMTRSCQLAASFGSAGTRAPPGSERSPLSPGYSLRGRDRRTLPDLTETFQLHLCGRTDVPQRFRSPLESAFSFALTSTPWSQPLARQGERTRWQPNVEVVPGKEYKPAAREAPAVSF